MVWPSRARPGQKKHPFTRSMVRCMPRCPVTLRSCSWCRTSTRSEWGSTVWQRGLPRLVIMFRSRTSFLRLRKRRRPIRILTSALSGSSWAVVGLWSSCIHDRTLARSASAIWAAAKSACKKREPALLADLSIQHLESMLLSGGSCCVAFAVRVFHNV